jgi:hypothetical protein
LDLYNPARLQWLTPVILATQEAEIRRIEIRSQLTQKGLAEWLKVEALSSRQRYRKKEKKLPSFQMGEEFD